MNLLNGVGRLRRSAVLLALPIVGGALALAPAAQASTTDYQTCAVTTLVGGTPAPAGSLQACINTVNAAGGNWEITLPNGADQPTQPLTLDAGVNLEITGASPEYTYNPTTLNGSPELSGAQIASGLTDEDFFTVSPGANLLVKGVNIANAGKSGFAAFDVQGDAEFDNDSFLSDAGYDVWLKTVTTTPNAVISNSTLFGSTTGGGVLTDDTSTADLYDDTIVGKALGGVAGNVNLVNTLFAADDNATNGTTACNGNSDGTENITAVNVIEDDGSCQAAAGSGVTEEPTSSLKLAGQKFNGGPVESDALNVGSTAIGQATGCLQTDTRFFDVSSTSTCDVGAYQTSGTADTIKPVCGAPSVNYAAPGGATDTVNVSDAGAGLGPDSVTTFNLALNSNATTGTTPGTVFWDTLGVGTTPDGPFTGPTWWDATSPSAAEPDFPSTSPFTVTAQKNAADTTVDDTQWSFLATDWAGQTTTCS
jgi:hypothetical protein